MQGPFRNSPGTFGYREKEGNTEIMKKYRNCRTGWATLLGVVCWLTYFSIYLGRLNFSASMSGMLQTGLWGKGQLGSVAAAFYLAYGIGQFPSGLLGDRLSPKWMIGAGLFGSALMNALFPMAQTAAVMRGMWFVNGLLQAMIWPPMVRLVTDLVGTARSVRLILLLSFSSPAGMLCTYLACGALLRLGSWKWCFLLAGIWLAGTAVLWILSISGLEYRIRSVSVEEKWMRPKEQYKKRHKTEEKAVSIGSTLRMTAASGMLGLTAAAFLHGILKDGLTTWIPTYLTEKFSVSASFSVLLTTVLPVVSLCGIPLAQTANRLIFRNEAASGALFYLLSLGSLLCMLGGPGNSLYGTVLLFAVVSGMMTAVNTLLVSLLPLHFGKEGRVATVSGALNAVTYLGSAAASALFGYTMEYTGWQGTQMVWCVCGAAGVCSCTAAMGKWKRNRKDIYGERYGERHENNTGIL